MTKVSYIHGLGNMNHPKNKAKKRFINYGSMTDGELRLSLMAEQLNIVAEYYGSDEHKEGQKRIIQSLENGIDQPVTMPAGIVGKAIAKEMHKARRMKRPASGSFISKSRKTKGVGDPLIDLPNCDDLMEWDENRDGLGYDWQPTPASRACEDQNKNLRLLNEHLEGSAHHLLYEYYDGDLNSIVGAKRVLHRNAVSKLGDITEVERTNLRMWMRNGVLRNNIANGAPPLQPNQVIEILKAGRGMEALPSSSSVGEITLFTAIVSAIIAAITATATLIDSLTNNKKVQMMQAAQGIGNGTFGPEEDDWDQRNQNPNLPPLDNNTELLNSDMMPLILGGAALLLLK